jgi:5'-phosphate synthase pdxT subunit
MRVGVLAAQGAFIEHTAVLKKLGVEAVEVRLPGELKGLEGLIIPGGESTSISRIILDFDLMDEIRNLGRNGFPIFGTCAGLVLLAKKIPGSTVETLGLMGITVRRNAFGRQVDSFETELAVPVLGEKPFHAVFIRAPLIERVDGNVEVLAKLDNRKDANIVAARQERLLVTAFHPELTDDLRFHQYFLKIIEGSKS